jgi:4-amino-4-deoxy-L-arabinose transferase-like glycosyltransferase
MFLPWYGLHGGDLGLLFSGLGGKWIGGTANAWTALDSVRFVLLGLVLVALLPAALQVTGQQAAARAAARIAGACAVATGLALGYRLVDQPGDDGLVDVRYGAYAGMAAVAAIALSAWAASRAEAGDAIAAGAAPAQAPLPAAAAGTTAARRPGLVALTVVGALAAFAAFYRLGAATWHYDEYLYTLLGERFLSGRFDQTPGPHPYLGVYALGLVGRLAGSDSSGAIRIAPAVAGLVAGGALFLLARRVAGLWAGVIALAMWALLPHATAMAGVALTDLRIERYGLLDVFMEAFTAVALLGGWRWAETGSWRWAATAGVAAGLAASSKLIGASVLVPIWLLAVVAPGRDRRRLAQTAALSVLCVSTFALSLAPTLRDAPARVAGMFDSARQQEIEGHTSIIAGHLYTSHSPWWGNGWFLWHGVGPVATVAVVLAAALGAVVLDRRLVMYLATAVLLPLVALAGLYQISLPHYYYVAMAPLTLLAALGLHEIGRRQRAGAAVAGGLGVILVGVAGTMLAGVATTRAGDYREAASDLRRAGLDRGNVVVYGYAPVMCAYLPHARFPPVAGPDSDALVVDPLQTARSNASWLWRFLAANGDRLRPMRADRLRVYVRRDPRTQPSRSREPVRASPLDCFQEFRNSEVRPPASTAPP